MLTQESPLSVPWSAADSDGGGFRRAGLRADRRARTALQMCPRNPDNPRKCPRDGLSRILRFFRTGCGESEEGSQNRRTRPASNQKRGRLGILRISRILRTGSGLKEERAEGCGAAPAAPRSDPEGSCTWSSNRILRIVRIVRTGFEMRDSVVRLFWLPGGRHRCIQSPDFSDPSEGRQEPDCPGYLPRESREGWHIPLDHSC